MKANKKNLIGTVVSDKMEKTVVVEVSTRKLHPIYKKYVAWSKKYKVHDPENTAHKGDQVRIAECRPISRHKCWRLVAVIEHVR